MHVTIFESAERVREQLDVMVLDPYSIFQRFLEDLRINLYGPGGPRCRDFEEHLAGRRQGLTTANGADQHPRWRLWQPWLSMCPILAYMCHRGLGWSGTSGLGETGAQSHIRDPEGP